MYRVIACIALILTAATPVAAQVASESLPETARPAPAATVEAPAGPAEDLYARAVEALEAGRVAQARDLWVAFKQNDMAAARLWLEAAHAWSDNIDIALRVGVLREQDGRPVDALAAYRRVITAPSIPYSVDATFRRTAEDAIARLDPEGRQSPGDLDAADLASRQSTLVVPGLAAAATGDVLVSVGTDATVDDVLILGPADALAPVAHALKGTTVPGGDVARARQLRLFRKATVDCVAGGACALEWQRIR